jgi:hypothetical protein
MTIYLVFSSFSSRQISLLTKTEVSVFSFTVRMLAHDDDNHYKTEGTTEVV